MRSDQIDGVDVSGRTVLVTGGAGFIGSHIADALAAENEVRVLDDFSNGRPGNVPDGATVVEGDLADDDVRREAMAGVDLVFHEAGLVSVPESVERPLESHRRNVTATLALLEDARREDARVVVASSVAIYGDPIDDPIRETHRTAPASPYGVDKLALDHYTRLYHDRYGLDTVALRYFNVYGPGQAGGAYSGVVSRFLDRASEGRPLPIEGDGTQTRDFVHVSDVVRANLAAATTDAVGAAYNVGTGESVSIRELAETVIDVTDADVDIVHTDARPDDVSRSRADVGRARNDLGFEAEIDLQTGLADLVTARSRTV